MIRPMGDERRDRLVRQIRRAVEEFGAVECDAEPTIDQRPIMNGVELDVSMIVSFYPHTQERVEIRIGSRVG